MSDYGGYKAILEEAKEIADEEKQREIVDCPVCGTPLDENSRGEKNCPMGHYRAPAGTTQAEGR